MTVPRISSRQAVLDWDLKSERAYADGPTVAMSELAVNIFSKTESLPHKFRPAALPKIVAGAERAGRGSGLTSLQGHLMAVLRVPRKTSGEGKSVRRCSPWARG